MEDLPTLRAPTYPDHEHLLTLLEKRGVRHVGWSDWLRLGTEERRLGATRGAGESRSSNSSPCSTPPAVDTNVGPFLRAKGNYNANPHETTPRRAL